MSTVTVPHSIKDFPANSRLQLPALLAKVLSLKCHLRERLVHAYKSDDRDELEALGGRSGDSRMSRLRVDVESLHRLHRFVLLFLFCSFRTRLMFSAIGQTGFLCTNHLDLRFLI